MTTNDVLRRIRFIGNYSDQDMVALFKHTEVSVTTTQIQSWLKKEEDDDFVVLADSELASFLNGLIIEKRGKREGPLPVPEQLLTNNLILQKLKIAYGLNSDAILAMLKSVNMPMSPHELSAFFRKPGHRHYRPMLDQFLRNFLRALQKRETGK